jgi:hypothetical protein
VLPEGVLCEVVLVDNVCSDDTVELAVNYWSCLETSIPLRITQEPILGLSPARIRGILSASYEYMLFCDDDTWLCAGYVKVSYEILSQHPGGAAVGGWGNSVFEASKLPAWMSSDKFKFSCKDKPAIEGEDDSSALSWDGFSHKTINYAQTLESRF